MQFSCSHSPGSARVLLVSLIAVLASCSDAATSRIGAPQDTALAGRVRVRSVAVVTEPSSSAQSGAAFAQEPAVQLRDSNNNPVKRAGISVSATIASGGGTLGGTTTVTTDATGLATFTNLEISGAVGSRTLAFNESSVSATSTAIAISAGAASKLAIAVQPSSSAESGVAFSQQPTVQLVDAWGNAVAQSGVAVAATVASGGGTLSGTASVSTSSTGAAAFTNLAITGSGSQTLAFTASGLGAATSNAISVSTTTVSSTGGTTSGGSATTLLSENFDDANLAGRGWYDIADAISISNTEHISGSTGSLQINWPAGAITPSPNTAFRHTFSPSNAVYVSYWVKHSSNFVGSGVSYHPHEFYLFTTEDGAYVSPAWNHLTAYIEENYSGGDSYAVINSQDGANVNTANIGTDLTSVTENRAIAGCNGNPDNTPTDCYKNAAGNYVNGKEWRSSSPMLTATTGSFYKGDWHKVEAYIKLNSIVNGIGQRDGIAQYWVDGTQVINRTDLMFRTGAHPNMQFNQFFVGPYIGVGSPVSQTMWIDNLVLMTAHP